MPNQTDIINIVKLLFSPQKARDAFHSYHLVRRKYILKHACAHFKTDKFEPAPLLNKTLLDLGCKNSGLAQEMVFRGADVTAVDISPQNIKNAQKKAEEFGAEGINFIHGSPDSLIQTHKKFDIILCMDLFEYVDHTSQFINQITTLLKEDGILIFSTNNRTLSSYLWHILLATILFKWVPKETYKFRRFRPPQKLIGKLEDKNFKIIDMCGVYLEPTIFRWKRRDNMRVRYLGAATPAKKQV